MTLRIEPESDLEREPEQSLTLARVRYANACRSHDAQLQAGAELALIRAWNACANFRRALELCPTTARHFQELDRMEQVARAWLEAAWAETYLGDLDRAETYLERAAETYPGLSRRAELNARSVWIRARILREHGDFKAALEEFDLVRQQLLAVGKRIDAARVLREIGHTQTRLNPADAFPALQRARQVFVRTGQALEVAICDLLAGGAHTDLGRFEKADESFHSAWRVLRVSAGDYYVAWWQLEMGFLACARERFAESLGYFKVAWRKYNRIGAQQELASCEVNLGWALMKLNRYSEALEYLEHSAEIAVDTGRKSKAAVCFSNIGWILEKQGHYARALEYLERARDIFQERKMAERLVQIDLDLAQLYLQLGDLDQAMAILARARRVCQRERMSFAYAQCELYRAHALYGLNEFALAQRALKAARRSFVTHGLATSRAICERLLAKLKSGHRRISLGYLTSSRNIFGTNKLVVDVALCDVTRGELALEWGEWEEAQRALQRAAPILAKCFPDQEWRIAFGFGAVAQAQNDIRAARRFYVNGARALGRWRGTLQLEALSNEVFGVRRAGTDTAVAFMHEHGYPEDALILVETAKAQTFTHALAIRAWRTNAREQGKEVVFGEKELKLRSQLDEIRAKLIATPADEKRSPTRAEASGTSGPALSWQHVAKLERAYERVASQKRLSCNGLTGAPTIKPFDLIAFREAADARWGGAWSALDYYFANGHLYTLWVTRDDARLAAVRWSAQERQMLHDCASTHPDLREVVYRQTLHGARISSYSSRALEWLTTRLVPAPLLEQQREQTLLVSPHGLLHQLPFHALRYRDHPLLERFTLQYTPNLQTFTQLTATREKRKKARKLVYGLGEFGGRAPALAHSRQEVNALAVLTKSGDQVYWQEAATRQRLLEWNQLQALRQFEVLHLATHAVVEPRAPHASRIMLADQALTVLDVMELDLDAGLVTLSACSSAVGKGGSGDEWVSLARAFFYAGARTIVASLWEVEDESTAKLMTEFYRSRESGKANAEALRQAQLKLYNEGYSAFHWAPFMTLGAG